MGRKKNADAPAPKSAPKAAPKAPASKLPGRKKFPTEKLKAMRKKKSADSDSSDDSADDDEDGDVEAPENTALDVDWKDNDLSVTLVALIGENKDIKRSLFPPCGPNASTKNGGGTPKTHALWELAVLLFGEMDKFKDAIAACTTPKQKRFFANKIKNRLGAMAKITRKYNKEMGETGAGITSASQINMNATNTFTTKWGTYCPPNIHCAN
ncbi:hypothetical protein B0H13DRAFT_1871766 [Mycena leptocephala]|nr:hypothetical protein B0H13DRAFT_1926846 [Mycena leptocephala]KAJ7915761.1 hypothetical protein B0H13DRAFT_1871766 [Mycena leptocephala]